MTKKEMIQEYRKCKESAWYFLSNHVKTYNGDTGQAEPFATFNNEFDLPDNAYQTHIKQLIDEIQTALDNGGDFHIDKTRQMYLTQTLCGVTLWAFLFKKGFTGLLTSEKENKIDMKGNQSAMFEIIRYMIEHIDAEYLKPDKKYITSGHMKLAYSVMETSLIGEAGDNPGMGMQIQLAIGDEWAYQPNSYSRFRAIREATKKCLIIVSTPNGKHNHFADIKFNKNTSFKKKTFHWSMRRLRSWYDWKRDTHYAGNEQACATELDISYETSKKGRVFKHFDSVRHIMVSDIMQIRNKTKVLPIRVGFDFGWSRYTSNVFLYRERMIDNRYKYIAFAEHLANETPVKVHCEVYNQIKDRFEIPAINIINYADPSGISHSREEGRSSFELFGDYGVKLTKAENAVSLGISTINTLFHQDRLVIHESCINLIDALQQAQYPVNAQGEPISEKYDAKQGMFIDILDGLRYALTDEIHNKPVDSEPKKGGNIRVRPGLGIGSIGGRE